MATLLEYKCPCCDGKISFDSTLQKMLCPYCGTEFDMETLKGYDDVLKEEQPDDLHWQIDEDNQWRADELQGMNVYNCQSCGGEIIVDENTAASRCPYCDNPIVMTRKLSGDMRPDYVIPFKLDKNAAKEALKKHFEGKRLLPKAFKEENHLDEIQGVYVPFWLFDADVDANIRYRATRLRHWSDSRYEYTETSYYAVTRAGKVGFQRVPVDGSSKMADDLMESIEPFRFEDAVDFQTAYLAGYLADRYDVTAEQSIERANARIKRSTEQAFAATVKGYSSVVPQNSSISLKNGTAKYAMYPVWLLNTNWNGKKYTFAMNGQTGKLVGDLPMDKKLFWRWFGIYTAIFGAAVYALQWIMWLL